MANAWMIRYDGKEIPVTVHIYGSTEDVEETLYASEWLYNNTTDSSVKEQIRSLVATYAHELDPDAKPAELEDTMLYQIKHLPYKTVDRFQYTHSQGYPDLTHRQLLCDVLLKE